MRTDKFIDLVMSRAAASLTRAEALSYTNEVQNFIMGRAIALSRVQPDPILETQDDTYLYVANDSVVDDEGDPVSDIYTIRRVYREGERNESNRFERTFHGDQGCQTEIGAGFVPSKGPDLDDCRIVWPRGNNPGDTDSRWRCEAFVWPEQLESEEIPLTVPADAHLSLLLMGVLEQVEAQEYGNGGWPSAKFVAALEDFDNKHSVEVVQPGPQTANTITYTAC